MRYRITYRTAEGTTRLAGSDPDVALKFALQLIEQGKEEVWLSDDEGHLFTPREFEAFLAKGR